MNYKINKGLFSNPWLALVLITITATIIYSNIYNAPLVFDDTKNIVENKNIKDLSHYSPPGQIIKKRNIAYLTFAINYKLSGLNVIGYHIFNVLIHIANGFLVYLLSLIIFKRLSTMPSRYGRSSLQGRQSLNSKISLMSLFAALIFVAHPIQTQAVTYTVQRMASMAAMFYMASVFFYLRARIITQDSKPSTHRQENKYYLAFPPEWRSRAGYILSGFCGALAFLSKENAASLPGAILLVEFLFINRTWHVWKKMIPWFAFSFAFWFVFASYTLGFLGVFSSESGSGNLIEMVSERTEIGIGVSRWQYLCTQFNVLVIYIRLLFLPINQCLDYLYPYKDSFLDGYTPIAFSFLMGIIGIGVWSIRKRPIISLAAFWFFITLSVESSIIPLYAYFEHRLYLPMFGFAVFASWLLFHLFPNKRSLVIVVYVVIIISLGTATYHRNRVWQDEMKLWSDCVSKNPKNHRAHKNLGRAILLQQGNLDDALLHLKEALRIKPNYAKAHNTLGAVLDKKGKLDDALLHFREALRIWPDYAKAHNNLGVVLGKKEGKLEDSLFHLKEALRIKPNYAKAHNNLGLFLSKEGKLDDAITHYKEALRINPDYANTHNNLGNALLRQDKLDDAITHYKEALRINPDYADTHNNLGNALLRQDKLADALLHLKEALRINPDYAEAHNNLGLVLGKEGKLDDALLHLKEALRIKPDNAEAHNNLGVALSKEGKLDDALFHFKETVRIKPDDVDVRNNLQSVLSAKEHYNKGLVLDSQGQIDDASTEYHKALQIIPDYAKAHNNIGITLIKKGELDHAITHYKEALRINPDFKEAQYNLELALKEIGEKDKSLKAITTP